MTTDRRERTDEDVDVATLRALRDAAAVQPRGEWFVAGREDDDEHPWWLFSFEECAAGDECDHDECTTVPVVALCPYDDSLGTDERVAEWAAAAFNAQPALLSRLAVVERERDEMAEKLAALREHTLDSNPALRALHSNAVAYLDAVAALAEVRGAPLSTSLAWLIRQGYLVPANPVEVSR